MSASKKTTKFLVIFILFGFLLITVLSAIVPYLGGNQNDASLTGDALSGKAVIQTGLTITGNN